jgi:putative glutamine amidotransferase
MGVHKRLRFRYNSTAMAVIGVTSADRKNAKQYVEALEKAGGKVRLIMPGKPGSQLGAKFLEGVSALLLTGGPDIDPQQYGGSIDSDVSLKLCAGLDFLELAALRDALKMDLPVLGISRGMHVINVAFGGKLLQSVPGHYLERPNNSGPTPGHQVYVSPGSKLAAVMGMGGFFKVNSVHNRGLRFAQSSPKLLASAYSLQDGIVEGLESPEHSWVIGVQWHPERVDEVSRSFANLFASFVERAEKYDKQYST